MAAALECLLEVARAAVTGLWGISPATGLARDITTAAAAAVAVGGYYGRYNLQCARARYCLVLYTPALVGALSSEKLIRARGLVYSYIYTERERESREIRL